jgi:ADP-ribose pyrophosphatase
MAVGETLLELPAGTLEPPEAPLETARRELIEETGYACREMSLLSRFYASPGVMSERMYLYSATGLTAGAQHLEHGEEIQTVVTPWKDALQMALDGSIRDAKTLVGILLCGQLKSTGQWPKSNQA